MFSSVKHIEHRLELVAQVTPIFRVHFQSVSAVNNQPCYYFAPMIVSNTT